jgi:hypothetical protein
MRMKRGRSIPARSGYRNELCASFVSLAAIRALVRELLHCGCPDQVFDDVRIGVPGLFGTHGASGGLEILVGGRLLIALLPLSGLSEPFADAAAVLQAGRRARDAHGLNRFRLVLVGAAVPAWRDRLDELVSGLDDRVHVHFVEHRDFDARFGA